MWAYWLYHIQQQDLHIRLHQLSEKPHAVVPIYIYIHTHTHTHISNLLIFQ